MTDKAWTAIEEQVMEAIKAEMGQQMSCQPLPIPAHVRGSDWSASLDDVGSINLTMIARAALEASHHQELVKTIEALIDRSMDPFIWKRARAVLAKARGEQEAEQ